MTGDEQPCLEPGNLVKGRLGIVAVTVGLLTWLAGLAVILLVPTDSAGALASTVCLAGVVMTYSGCILYERHPRRVARRQATIAGPRT